MNRPDNHRFSNSAGFTLAEILVASILLSIVMAAVYTAFSSSVRLWRLGEANIQTYQDARTSLSIMTRELENVVPGAAHLIKGTDDELEFFAVVPPMEVEEDDGPRVLRITYRTRSNPEGEGKILLREERLVESPLPSAPPEDGEIDSTIIKLASENDFELAVGVKDFALSYYWLPPEEQPDALGNTGPPVPVEFIVRDEHPEGSGIPQGIKIELTLLDPNVESGETTFATYVVFRGVTTRLEEDSLETEGGRFQ